MGAPLVSIITPAYNAGPYIGATARTVLAQSLADWEWLIVDDGSTDDTAAIVAALGDERVRLIRAGHSGLPAVGRNTGITAARGDYIALLDADDLWEPDKLALQMAYFADHPNVGLVFSRFYYWFDHHKRPRAILPDTRGLPNPGWVQPQLCEINFVGTSSVVVRRELIVGSGGFDQDVRQRATEDYELWLRLAALAPFGYIDRPLYWYRMHSANLSSEQSRLMEGHLLALEKTFRRHPELYDQPQLSAARMAARKLRWHGSGRLFDGVDDCGWNALLQSVKIWPADSETWKLLALSCLGPVGIKTLRRISRFLH